MKRSRPHLIEACVESAAEAIKAEAAGADQIELCKDLSLDGLTPKYDEVLNSLSSVNIPVKVMIRPNPGHFIVDNKTLVRMMTEIKKMRNLGVQHFVFGITDSDGHLDILKLELLIREVHPLKVTIHKAIDTCHDPVEEAGRLVTLGGVTQILTSGGSPTALEGASVIRSMINRVQGQIDIIAAGSITKENLEQIHREIQAPVYHGRKIVGSLD